MKLSIVIVTWNSAEDIKACLESLRFSRPFETIVVDHASTDPTLSMGPRCGIMSPYYIRLVANPRNLGYARANNQGIGLAQGEYILLLNPDTKLEPDVLGILTRYLDNHPDVGAVAPKLLNPDGTTQHSIRSFPTASTVLWELTGLSRLFPKSQRFGRWRMAYFDYGKAGEVDQPMASCLMIRRIILEQLGGLDQRFSMFFNDVDLSWRMHAAGWKTVYLPQARVFHRRGASTGQVKPKMIWESHRSLFRFLHKHDRKGLFWLKAVVLLPMLEFAALIRVIAYRLKHDSN